MNARNLFLAGATLLIGMGSVFSLFREKGTALMWLAEHRVAWADYFFYYVTQLGEPIGFTLIGIYFWLSSWRKMILIPVLGLVVTIVAYLLKNGFAHERPLLYLQRIGWEGPMQVLDYHINTGHQSFPSGHSMAAWALFSFTALMIRRPWVSAACLFLAAAVSLSRVYLMVHFLQDVVAGAAVGLVLGVMGYYLFGVWERRRPARPSAGAPDRA